jgi:hypothetical protein
MWLHWPGTNFVLILSLSTLAIIYWPGAFYFFCDKVIKQQNTILSIVSGAALSIIPMGILFKMMHWPGANFMLLIGLTISPFVFAVIYIYKSKADESLQVYYKNMLLRSGVLGVLAAAFFFTSTPMLLRVQYRGDPEMARLKILHYTHPDNDDYRKQHDEYVARIDSVERSAMHRK